MNSFLIVPAGRSPSDAVQSVSGVGLLISSCSDAICGQAQPHSRVQNDVLQATLRCQSCLCRLRPSQRLARCINSKDITEFVEYLVDMLYLQQNIYLNELKIMAYYLSDDLSQENAHEDEIIEK